MNRGREVDGERARHPARQRVRRARAPRGSACACSRSRRSGRSPSLGGIVWAIAQPYRVTFFYPGGKGFWDWLVQPPLLVVLRRSALRARSSPRAGRGPRAKPRMLPRAEIAHWLFAAGFLFFGLVLLAEAIVGPEVFRRRAWRACLWPCSLLVAGVLLWLIAIFSTFSTLHLLAHSVWAQAATAAGAVQLAVVRGKLSIPSWSLVTAGGAGRHRALVPPARAERLALRPLGLPPPPDRLDAASSPRSSRSARRSGRDAPCGRTGSRRPVAIARDALRATATWRRSSDISPSSRAARREARARGRVCPRARAARRRIGARHDARGDARRAGTRRRGAAEVVLRFDQSRDASPGGRSRSSPRTAASSPVPRRRGAPIASSPPPSRGSNAARTPFAGGRLSADGHTIAGVFTFGVRRRCHAADRSRRGVWPDLAGRCRALGAVRLARSARRPRRDPSPRAAAASMEPRVERRVHLLGDDRRVRGDRCGDRRARVAGSERATGLRSSTCCTPTSRRLRSRRDSASRSWSRRSASACAPPWSGGVGARPAGAPLAGVRCSVRCSRPGSRSPVTRRPSRTRRCSTELADWVHLVAAMLWVGGVVPLAVVVWPLAPHARRAAFLRFSRIAVFLVAVIVVAGTYLAIVRLPGALGPVDDRLRAALLLKIGDRVRRARMGWDSSHVRAAAALRGDSPRGVRRSLLGESSVAVAVLLIAAILVNGSPPPVGARRWGVTGADHSRVGSLAVLVAISGGAGFLGLHSRAPARRDGVTRCARSTSPRSAIRSWRATSKSSAATSAPNATRGGSSAAPTSSSTRRRPSRSRCSRAAIRSVNVEGTAVMLGAALEAGGQSCRTDLVHGGLRRAGTPPDRRVRPARRGRCTTASRRSTPSDSSPRSPGVGSRSVILRPKTFLGAERLGVFEILFDWIREGRRIPILGDGRNRYQLLAVEDLVDAVVRCFDAPVAGEALNVGAARFRTVARRPRGADRRTPGRAPGFVRYPARPAELALRGLELARLSPLAEWHYRTAHRDSFVSIERARDLLGWEPRCSQRRDALRDLRLVPGTQRVTRRGRDDPPRAVGSAGARIAAASQLEGGLLTVTLYWLIGGLGPVTTSILVTTMVVPGGTS